MAEPTYTVKVDCHRCGETTTMAGVRPTPIIGGGDLVNIAVHCDHCGAAGGYAVERRCLIGQPDYLANVDMAHGWSAAQIRVATETTFGTASPIGEPSAQPIDLTAGPFTAPLRPGIETHIRSSASMPPAPADEWSKPVKDEDGSWAGISRQYPFCVKVSSSEVDIGEDAAGASAPRDVVLRLLAAEASDRLGWVWEVGVDEFTGRMSARREDWPPLWSVWSDGDIVAEAHNGLPDTPDELLAAMHGRFLLLDALEGR